MSVRETDRGVLAPADGELGVRARNVAAIATSSAAAGVMVVVFASVAGQAAWRGLPGLSRWTEPMVHALIDSARIVGPACALGVPIGVGAGLYVAEVGTGRLALAVRGASDVLGGVPSILVGLVAYLLLLGPRERPSIGAGAVALAVILVPRVLRTTDDALRRVPAHLRDAALALGVRRWRTTIFVVLRTALPGVATGVLSAVARVVGVLTPLLLTTTRSGEAAKPLPLHVFDGSVGIAGAEQRAWAGAIVLVAVVATLNLLAGRRR